MVLEEEYLMMIYIGTQKSREDLIKEIRKAKKICVTKKGVIPDSIHVHLGEGFGLTDHGKSKVFTDKLTPEGSLIFYLIKKKV